MTLHVQYFSPACQATNAHALSHTGMCHARSLMMIPMRMNSMHRPCDVSSLHHHLVGEQGAVISCQHVCWSARPVRQAESARCSDIDISQFLVTI